MVRTLMRPQRLHDVTLRPAAVAKVLLAAGLPHETVAVPGVPLARGDVLVAIELTTVCPADLQVAQGRRTAPLPVVLGHESVGRIIALGDGGAVSVEGGELRVGDRIVWSALVPCGSCDRCEAGAPHACRRGVRCGLERVEPRWELTGGFASHVHLRAGTAIVRVPESLPAAVLAPAACTVATAWAAVTRAAAGRRLDGASVRVIGAGAVGLSAAAIAAAHDVRVTVVEAVPERQDLAERFGATRVQHPRDRGDDAADIVIDTTGLALADALAAVVPGGAVVLAGAVPDAPPVEVDAAAVAERQVSILGVRDATARELSAAIGFLAGAGRAAPFAELVGAVHPLDDVDAALAAAAAATAPPRVALSPR